MNHSDSIKNIAAALAEFQADVKDPARNGENPHFRSKYVQLDGLLAAVRPLLSKHGLSVIQSTGGDGQNISVSTMLMHKSGEWIETDALVLRAVKTDPQGAGSAVTYGRRYGLSAALGVARDDDDDGNAASAPPKAAVQPSKNKDYYIKQISSIAKTRSMSTDDIKAVIKSKYNKSSSKYLTDAEAKDLAEHLEDYMIDLIEAESMRKTEGMQQELLHDDAGYRV